MSDIGLSTRDRLNEALSISAQLENLRRAKAYDQGFVHGLWLGLTVAALAWAGCWWIR